MDDTTKTTVNIYSDESHHLAGQAACMVIGAVWCEKDAVSEISDKITLIKTKHEISKFREIKWIKVSRAKEEYYRDLIRYFFDEERLNFRAVVVPYAGLHHEQFEQTPDQFYYKMQYLMMINIIRKRSAGFHIYLDYKDSWSHQRSQKLAEYLSKKTDFADRQFFAQPVRSHESSLLQLADLLVGAVAAKNNGAVASDAKRALVKLIEERSFQQLDAQSPNGVDKLNIFKWQPQTQQD